MARPVAACFLLPAATRFGGGLSLQRGAPSPPSLFSTEPNSHSRCTTIVWLRQVHRGYHRETVFILPVSGNRAKSESGAALGPYQNNTDKFSAALKISFWIPPSWWLAYRDGRRRLVVMLLSSPTGRKKRYGGPGPRATMTEMNVHHHMGRTGADGAVSNAVESSFMRMRVGSRRMFVS